jgi:hypothetical protein
MPKASRAKSRDIRRIQEILKLSYTEAKTALEATGLIRSEWTQYGWYRLLPYEAMSLELAISTAHVLEKSGTIEELLRSEKVPENANSSLTWPDSDPESGAEFGPRLNARAAFVYAMEAAGLENPFTLGELAHVLAALGVYEHKIDIAGRHYWTIGNLVRTVEVLSLPDEWVAIEEEAWWRTMTLKPAFYLSEWIVEKKWPSRVKTSIGKLSAGSGMKEEGVRNALDGLLFKERAALWRNSRNLDRAEARELDSNARFEIELIAIEEEESGNEAPLDDWEDLSLETIQWTESPWTICLAAAETIGLSDGPGQLLAELPFRLSVRKGSTSVTSIAELAAGNAVSPEAAARSSMELERIGALRWNSQKQVAEVAQYAPFRSASKGQ